MSLRQCQQVVSSAEFAEWMAFYVLEAQDSDPNRQPTPEELGDKIAAWAAMHGSARPGAVVQERR